MLSKNEFNKFIHNLKRISYTIKSSIDDLNCVRNDLELLQLECDKLHEDMAELEEKNGN